MKRGIIFAAFLVSSLVGSSVLTGWGAPETPPAKTEEPKTYTWQEKLKRGGLNIVTSPVEVARQIHLTTQESNLLKGWTVGLFQGAFEGCMRLGAGIIDVLTCPFNFPDSHKGPLVQPEYVWEKGGVKYT